MADFWYRLVTPSKRHCFAKLTLYVHICHVCDGLYASWRVKATPRYRFITLVRKPRPRSQSYIGPTTVGPDIYVQCVSPFYEELNVCAHNSHTCESRLLCEKVSLL